MLLRVPVVVGGRFGRRASELILYGEWDLVQPSSLVPSSLVLGKSVHTPREIESVRLGSSSMIAMSIRFHGITKSKECYFDGTLECETTFAAVQIWLQGGPLLGARMKE